MSILQIDGLLGVVNIIIRILRIQLWFAIVDTVATNVIAMMKIATEPRHPPIPV